MNAMKLVTLLLSLLCRTASCQRHFRMDYMLTNVNVTLTLNRGLIHVLVHCPFVFVVIGNWHYIKSKASLCDLTLMPIQVIII